MRRSSAVLVATLMTTWGCSPSGPDLTLAQTKTFRLARLYDQFNIGIDLELQVPAGYRFTPNIFHAHWHRNNDPSIRVTREPREQATFELPCGDLVRDTYGTTVVVSRTERPDDLTVVCEKHLDGNKVNRLWIVRLIRSIDDVIECRVTMLPRHHAAKYRAPGIAICDSLRVLGRSPWTSDDYLK